ncbi:hypothetical protein LTS18_012307 [Coniosporium uncinatum]|uniref:Uncharacterized protein n=1 Tax=Coniosporium uncinatum TaxID=93489 RepID=A0ACC3CY28_9PEZI|nr:hypothetical protein LTS18_012307 [Coniosporium uncinatum]
MTSIDPHKLTTHLSPSWGKLEPSNSTRNIDIDMDGYDQSGQGQIPQKKKRAYAQQAYEFGQNAGAPPGSAAGQPPPPMMPGYGTPGAAAPSYGGAAAAPGYGASPAPAQYGASPAQGYGAPHAPGYGAPPPGPQDQLAGQFGQMNIGQQQVPPQPQQSMQSQAHINQLFPSDLISQPFSVQELDLPPPPINLPPNVSIRLGDADEC